MILRCRIIRCVYVDVCMCVCVYVPCALVCGCHSSCAIALNKFDKRKKKKVTKKKKNWKSIEVGHESWREILTLIVSVIVKYCDAHTLTPSLILSEKYNILES